MCPGRPAGQLVVPSVTNSLARATLDAEDRRVTTTSALPAIATLLPAAAAASTGSGVPEVLLVGCDGEDHLYLRTRLSLRRLLVHHVPTAAEAIDHCAEHATALVFIDIDGVGREAGPLCRQLMRPHACRPTPAVVLMGARPRGLRWRWQVARSGGRWLDKPLHPRALDAAILRGLGGRLEPAEGREIVSLFQ